MSARCSLIVNGKAVRMAALKTDKTLFDTVFDPANLDPAARARAERHKLLVDRSYERYRALTSDPRLSAADRQRLEAHVADMTDLQKRLAVATACTKPAFTSYTTAKPREVLWRNNIDTLVAAMACDMTSRRSTRRS